MKFRRYPGIRLKMTLAFGVVFALLSLLLNLYSYNQIRQLIIADNNRFLLALAQSLLNKTEVNPVIIPLPDKNTLLRIYARHADGKRSILFQSPGELQSISIPNRPGVTDINNLRVAYVINTSEDNPAELMMAVSNSALQTTLRYLFLLLLLSTLFSVLISGVISFWLSRLFLLQVQKIISIAKGINAGQTGKRVPVKETNDELQELSETINGMLQRIDRSLQQQQNFFAAASHELKTPLAVMRAELEVNLRRLENSPEFNTLLNNQLEEINRLQYVVQEFLIISQIKAGKLNIIKEPFDISDLLLRVVHQLQPLAQIRNLKIDVQFDEEAADYTVLADKEKIRLVLINLLDNALKYGAVDSIVKCSITRLPDSDNLTLLIQNVATVQSVDTLSITNAFYQNDIIQNGAGIGLWLSKEILDAHQFLFVLKSSDFYFDSLIQFEGYKQTA